MKHEKIIVVLNGSVHIMLLCFLNNLYWIRSSIKLADNSNYTHLD